MASPAIAHASPYGVMRAPDEPTALSLNPRVTTLKEGEPAPFDGTLMNPAATAQVIVDHTSSDEQCQIRIDKEVAIVRAEMQLKVDQVVASLEAANARIVLEQRHRDEQVKLLSGELERAQKQAGSSRWAPLYFAGGVAAGVLVIIAGAYAVKGVRETNI